MRRLGGLIVTAAVAWLLSAAPAAAEFTRNEVGCDGSAVITGDDGGDTVTVDANDSSATVPNAGVAAYEGSVDTVTHNHSGRIQLAVGPMDITLGEWGPSENEDEEASDSGTKDLPDELGGVPPGKYDLTGSHRGDEGGCAGHMVVEVDGDVTHPAVLASLALTAVCGLGLFGALRAVPSKTGSP